MCAQRRPPRAASRVFDSLRVDTESKYKCFAFNLVSNSHLWRRVPAPHALLGEHAGEFDELCVQGEVCAIARDLHVSKS